MTALGNELASETIAEVAHIVRKEHPTARGLILTGSAARDEAAIAAAPAGAVWLSDLDMLVVVDDAAIISREWQELNALSAHISGELRTRGVDVSIELKPAPRRYFRTIRPSMFGYELMVCGRQLFGDDDELSRIRRFGWRSIPLEDAWRLLSNRMVEWLACQTNPSGLPLPMQLQILTKQYLDLLTSLTLFSGHYSPTYRERVAALPDVIEWLAGTELKNHADLLTEAVGMSWEFRLHPSRFRWVWNSGATDLRSAMREAGCTAPFERLNEVLTSTWRTEAAWTCGRKGCGPEATPSMNTVYGLRGLIRGWAKVWMSASAGPSWRTVRLFARGTPRSLVYSCTARLLKSAQTQDPRDLRWVHRHLPAIFGGCGTGWSDLAGQCVRAWNEFLRHASA